MNKYWWKETDGTYQNAYGRNHIHIDDTNMFYIFKDYKRTELKTVINLNNAYFVDIERDVDDYPIE